LAAELGAEVAERRMTTPMWMLLGFATWTVVLLTATVGVYRWIEILLGRKRIGAFRSDQVEGDDWYRRSMRAHANCIENLPVFGAIVLALYASGVSGPAVDRLCVAVLGARVVQSMVHVSHAQTDAFVSVRFTFFCVQLVAFLALIALIVLHAVQG
jgi:uncharacterized MAPEG superfamily protein